ncbi:hypothetical protein [uncultured Kordia sp.]|uniref:hypothetical protein n=1 Tax=uncultured Kordia sp. TaxID=507699 RepID=UPI00263130E0|nr:hypothetical protein [uncultured Kordia sp.]
MNNTSLNDFKKDFYLDELDIYDYFFFLGHNFENFLLHNEKRYGNISKIETTVFKIDSETSKKKHSGTRIDQFNMEKSLITREDTDADSAKKTKFTYNEEQKLQRIEIKEIYLDNKKIEKYEYLYELMHYKDSIIILEREEDTNLMKRVNKYFIKDNKVEKLIDYVKMVGNTTTATCTDTQNGYEIYSRLGNLMWHRKKINHDKEKKEIQIVYSQAGGIYSEVIYKYDSQKNIINIVELDWKKDNIYLEKPLLKREYIIAYTYDGKGNWTQMLYNNITENETFTFNRKIDYF